MIFYHVMRFEKEQAGFPGTSIGYFDNLPMAKDACFEDAMDHDAVDLRDCNWLEDPMGNRATDSLNLGFQYYIYPRTMNQRIVRVVRPENQWP